MFAHQYLEVGRLGRRDSNDFIKNEALCGRKIAGTYIVVLIK
jgi:hypothetical protein